MPPLRHAPAHAQLIAPYQTAAPTARPVQAQANPSPPLTHSSILPPLLHTPIPAQPIAPYQTAQPTTRPGQAQHAPPPPSTYSGTLPPLRQLIGPYQTIDHTTRPVYAQPVLSVAQYEGDKENRSPPAISNRPTRPQEGKVQRSTPPKTTSAQADLPASYIDIALEEIDGEVPIYENAAAIRRKLNRLIETKAKIPGSTKAFNKTTMAKELQLIAERHHAIKTHNGMEDTGPSVQSLTKFLKRTAGMGGADTKTYYFGNMLLEKLRIWNGEKKTAARLKAEREFPSGRQRSDPDHMYYTLMVGEPRPSYSELANFGRRPGR